jgi:hypothetical protein
VTTLVLGLVGAVALVVLGAVLWSLVAALRAESSANRLRRSGVHATGTVVDNLMISTPQRRLVFSPVVEFLARSGHQVSAPAQQVAASSWPRGATVEVAYDPEDPTRFVLAGPAQRGRLLVNTLLGVVVVVILLGTMTVMARVWWEFRHDQGTPQPVVSPGPLTP